MGQHDEDKQYEARLQDIVIQQIGPQDLSAPSGDKRKETFTELLRHFRGAFPGVVNGYVRERMPSWRPPKGFIEEEPYALTEELHPLLFAWYFTPTTAKILAELSKGAGRSVTCLGTPTVASELIGRLPKVRLLDADVGVIRRFPEILKYGEFIPTPMSTVSQGLEASDVVIIDPPWYPGDVFLWLKAAHGVVRKGGTIILPLFPELTRPSASCERDILLDYCSSIGRLEIELQAATYSTPLFERESLRALGLPSCGDWRVADLIIVRGVSRLPTPPADYPTHGPSDKWKTWVIDGRVIKLNPTQADGPGALWPIPGLPGNVLTSPSDRDKRRELIGLWTSRNHVAGVANCEAVARWLDESASGSGSPTSLGDVESDEMIADFVWG